MYLGKRIKELRLKKGLTQLELANLLFVNDRTISKWEQERGNPDINVIPQLANILGVSIDYLMTGKEYCLSKEDNKNKAVEYFELLIGQEITNDYTRRLITRQVDEYDLESVKDALDKCFEVYLSKNNKPYCDEDIRDAASKIGGILHNQTLSPLNKKIKHLISFLSKNTRNASSVLKHKCEKSIKESLIFFDESDTDENKMVIIDKMYDKCLNYHLDLNDVILLNNREIETQRKNAILKKKISNGYLKAVEFAPDSINLSLSKINKLIIDKNINDLAKQILITLDIIFRYFLTEIDEKICEEEIPFITDYYDKLYNIFGRFLGRHNNRTIKYIVEKYTNDEFLEIDLEDLDLLRDFIDAMVYRINKRVNTAKYSYNRSVLFKD